MALSDIARWENRVALVTGASSGIGAAICKNLVKHGLVVIGCARRKDRIDVSFFTIRLRTYLYDAGAGYACYECSTTIQYTTIF
jgi:NAD(P)-dependent dehydrogenase (short-subunit alcohol dehydrogenase family)